VIFGKSSRCDTSRQNVQLWKLQNPECRTTDCPRRIGGVLLAMPKVKLPRDHPRTRWSDYISDLAWAVASGGHCHWIYAVCDITTLFVTSHVCGVTWSRRSAEPAELSEIAFYREGILGPPRAAPPRQSLGEIQTWKWLKIYWNGFCEVVMDVQLRFQVYFSHMKC